MIALKAQVHVLESYRNGHSVRAAVAGGSGSGPPEATASLRSAAITADARASVEIDLLHIWRELAGGVCSVIDGLFFDARCFLVLSPKTDGPANPVEARRLEILEAVLSGLRQKCIAIDRGVAPSTVASHFKLALASIGVAGRPSRAHPLLMLVGRAASSQTFARYSTFCAPDSRELRVISVPRPDQTLAAVLPLAELEVVRCLVEGLTHQEIARRRGTSTRTIANQISAVFRRLDVSGRNELVQRLFADGALAQRATANSVAPRAPTDLEPARPRSAEACVKANVHAHAHEQGFS